MIAKKNIIHIDLSETPPLNCCQGKKNLNGHQLSYKGKSVIDEVNQSKDTITPIS